MCLHCRHEARVAARQRRYRLAARIGLATTAAGVLVALIIGGLSAIASDARSLGRGSQQPDTTSAPAAKKLTGLQPRIAEGRSELGDSIFAQRVGREVTVSFDTETLRTRYDWKFEGVVRTTLPMVFGPDARAALDAIPSGTLVRGGDLLRELPTRGISLALAAHGSLKVWPITRPGRDGPLVVAYRAAASK